jgi:hypothetical protein
MGKRNRTRPTETFEERLKAFAKASRQAARSLPPGKDREELLRKARQAETTAHVHDSVDSTGLQPPK